MYNVTCCDEFMFHEQFMKHKFITTRVHDELVQPDCWTLTGSLDEDLLLAKNLLVRKLCSFKRLNFDWDLVEGDEDPWLLAVSSDPSRGIVATTVNRTSDLMNIVSSECLVNIFSSECLKGSSSYV